MGDCNIHVPPVQSDAEDLNGQDEPPGEYMKYRGHPEMKFIYKGS